MATPQLCHVLLPFWTVVSESRGDTNPLPTACNSITRSTACRADASKTSLRANMQHSLQMWRLEQYTSTCVSRIIGRTPSELKVDAASHPSAQAEGRRKNQAFQFSPCTRFAEKLAKFVVIIASNTAMPHPPLGSFIEKRHT